MGVTVDEGLCIEVLNTVARHGLPNIGNDVLRMLKEIGAPLAEHHLAAMIEAFCKTNRLKEAFETLHVMRENGITPMTETAYPIFEIIKRDIDSIDGTWAILDELREEGKSIDIVAINTIVRATVFCGDIQRAIGTYKAFVEYGLSPNIDTYNLLLSACIGVGHRSLGDHLLGEMKTAGVKPDARTYERLIILCLTQATYEDAFFYLEEMKANGLLPALTIYEGIIKKCVSVGDGRYKLALEEMRQCGYTISDALNYFITTGGVYQPPKTNGTRTRRNPNGQEGEAPTVRPGREMRSEPGDAKPAPAQSQSS